MSLAQKLVSGLIRAYQKWVSPLSGPRCRFAPSCSQYTREAVEVHGAMRGVAMGMKRLVRCHPWHAGGVDPVPARHAAEGSK